MAYCCVLFSINRIRFGLGLGLYLVLCCTHVFVLLSVVTELDSQQHIQTLMFGLATRLNSDSVGLTT